MWYDHFAAFDREHALARHYARQYFVAAAKISHGAHDETTVLEQDARGAVQRFAKRRVAAYNATKDDALAARYWRGIRGETGTRLGHYFDALTRYGFKDERFARQLRALSTSRDAQDFWLSVERLHVNRGKKRAGGPKGTQRRQSAFGRERRVSL